jgi:Ribosomal protein L7Ae/L30e/S12e/Gadd45 family
VLKKALAYDGLSRGLHEAARAIEKGQAKLCVLAEDCNQPDYKKLIEVGFERIAPRSSSLLDCNVRAWCIHADARHVTAVHNGAACSAEGCASLALRCTSCGQGLCCC